MAPREYLHTYTPKSSVFQGHIILDYDYFVEVLSLSGKTSKHFDTESQARQWIADGWVNADYINFD